jgi:hypothetical protein
LGLNVAPSSRFSWTTARICLWAVFKQSAGGVNPSGPQHCIERSQSIAAASSANRIASSFVDPEPPLDPSQAPIPAATSKAPKARAW